MSSETGAGGFAITIGNRWKTVGLFKVKVVSSTLWVGLRGGTLFVCSVLQSVVGLGELDDSHICRHVGGFQ